MDTVLDTAVWILCAILFLFSAIGFRQRYRKLIASALILATVGYCVHEWLTRRAAQHAEEERTGTRRGIAIAVKRFDARLSELTAQSLRAPAPDASAELSEMKKSLAAMHADAERIHDRVSLAEVENLQLRATLLDQQPAGPKH